MPIRPTLLNRLLLLIVLLVPLAALAQDTGRPGPFRITRDANLYARPSADSKILRKIPEGVVVNVVKVFEQWYEVRSTRPGNPSGFIRRSYADPAERSARGRRKFRPGIFRLTDPAIVRAAPEMESRKVASLKAGTEVRVLTRIGNWYQIESEKSGRSPGYIPAMSARRVGDIDVDRDADRDSDRDSGRASGRDSDRDRDRDYDRDTGRDLD
jgi:hypothetical protein